MRLVEVVMLMGAHCVSPVEQTQMMTDVAKVQCAVVVTQDTDKGTTAVTPPEAATNPQVMAAIERMHIASVAMLNGGATIEPARAPAGSPTREIKLPVARAPVVPEPAAPVANDVTSNDAGGNAAPVKPIAATQVTTPSAPVEKKVATLAPPPPKGASAKSAEGPKKTHAASPQKSSAAKHANQCKAPSVLKWYRTSDGGKKYHCVKPARDNAPNQLY